MIIKWFLLKLFIDWSQKPSNTENARSEFSNKFLKRLNLIDKQGDIKKPTRKLVLKKIKNALPILGWAVPYDWRGNLAGDVIAGVTLAVMQVLSGIKAVPTRIINQFIIFLRLLQFVNLILWKPLKIQFLSYLRNGWCFTSRCSSYSWNLLFDISCYHIWYIRVVQAHIYWYVV